MSLSLKQKIGLFFGPALALLLLLFFDLKPGEPLVTRTAAVVVLMALVVLDCTPYSSDPNHPTIYAIVTSVRNAIPSDALFQYEIWKAKAFSFLSVLFNNLFS